MSTRNPRNMPNVAYICENRHSPRVKAVVWMGGSREDLKQFPEAAQNSLGFELYRVQCGLDPKDWKPMPSVGIGVKEIRVRDAAGIFRMIYLATRPEGVYVLHCFQKKKSRTSRSDLELATKRFKSIAR
jgi:phage-related protein